MSSLPVTRCEDIRIVPDSRRVITKPFLPGEEVFPDGSSRIEVVLQRILSMDTIDVTETLRATIEAFVGRHKEFEAILERSFDSIADRHDLPNDLSQDRRLLIGSYFTHEYSVEGAALGIPRSSQHPINPS